MAIKTELDLLECFGRESKVQRVRTGSEVRELGHDRAAPVQDLHPAWRSFLAYCERLQYGEIERLKIQDGLPMVAEVTRKKVKFI